MAASTLSLPTGRFPISISEQLLREDGPRKRRRVNVQVNHKPSLSHKSTKTVITPSSHGEADDYNLAITDESNGNSYRYSGTQQPSEATALIYNPNDQSFTLDKIDAVFNFNLRSTPTNTDATSLAHQYPQLDTGLREADEEEGDGLFDEQPEDHDPDTEPPDPKNPYDYRHFLKSAQADPSPSPEPPLLLDSPFPNHDANSSPLIYDDTTTSPPHSHLPSKPTRRRSHPKPRHLSPNPREEADADNEDSEADDVLTIDMGDGDETSTSKNRRPWRSVLGALNEGGRSSGPISLRSAASSMSPSLRGDSDADVEEIDLGDGGVADEDEEERDFDEEGEEVNGVDAVAVSEEEEDEEEDPFAAQLEHQLIADAMSEAEQEENGGVRLNGEYEQSNGANGVVEHRVIEESSEESEEE